MKKINSIILLLVTMLAVLPLQSCRAASNKSDGNLETRTISVGDFDAIDCSFVKLEYTVGNPGDAVLTADTDIIDDIVVRNDKGTLRIGFKQGHNHKNDVYFTMKVASKGLKEIEAKVSALVNVNSALDCRKLKISTTTSSVVNIPQLRCNSAELSATTSSIIKIDNLKSEDIDIKSTTSAEIVVKSLMADELAALSTTSASISLDGGKVNDMDLRCTTSAGLKAALDYTKGEAVASTNGTIRTYTARLNSKKTGTGGSVKNIK